MLSIRGLRKQAGAFSLGKINLSVKRGEYFVLLGHSGAGKTLLLEIIAGFQEPDSGRILVDGQNIENIRIQAGKTGYLCRGDTLFPHMTVRENIAYGLRRRRIPEGSLRKKVEAAARETGAAHILGRSVSGLSAGERQRVALARMLVLEPSCFLLDEPLTGLDEILKQDILGLLADLHAGGRTFVHVTHDPQEALALATRIAVMEKGRIIQEGGPEQLLSMPRNMFTARLAGIRNFFQVRSTFMIGKGNARRLSVCPEGADETLSLSAACSSLKGPEPKYMVIDQGMIKLHRKPPANNSEKQVFRGRVINRTPAYRGPAALIIDIGFHLAAAPRDSDSFQKGEKVWVSWPDEAVRLYG